jgi:hypothetical protein
MCKSNECGCRCNCGCDCRGSCGRGCCCDRSGESGFERRHQTKAEQIAELEPYLNDLKAEVRAVEEKLADLKRKK